jgi:hypothetical protein
MSILASFSEEIKILVCQTWVVPPITHDIEEKEQMGVISVYEIEKEDWRQPLIDYLRHGNLTKDLRHKTGEAKSFTLHILPRHSLSIFF